MNSSRISFIAGIVLCAAVGVGAALAIQGRKTEVTAAAHPRYGELKGHAVAIRLAKSRCGIETPVAHEEPCECLAAKEVNRHVDAIDEILSSDVSALEVVIHFEDGASETVKNLVAERLPLEPGCN